MRSTRALPILRLPDSNTVTKLRTSDGVILGTFPVSGGPFSPVFDGKNVWVAQVSSACASSAEGQFPQLAGTQPADRFNDLRNVGLDSRPTRGWEDEDGKPSSSEILLVAEVCPAHLVRGRDGVVTKEFTQRRRHAVVEEDPHAAGSRSQRSGFGEAELGVLEHRLDLLASDAGEPVEEVIHPRSILEVLEERLHRHARALEQPRAADPSRDALNGRALRPIQHS